LGANCNAVCAPFLFDIFRHFPTHFFVGAWRKVPNFFTPLPGSSASEIKDSIPNPQISEEKEVCHMAEKYIRISGELVAVTEDVYYAYYHMGRQYRTQVEKDGRRQVASYDALDTEDHLGVDLLMDNSSPSVEDAAIASVMAEKLHRCLALLPEGERRLLEKIYFSGMTERQVAQTLGISQNAVNKRRHKILAKLRQLMKT